MLGESTTSEQDAEADLARIRAERIGASPPAMLRERGQLPADPRLRVPIESNRSDSSPWDGLIEDVWPTATPYVDGRVETLIQPVVEERLKRLRAEVEASDSPSLEKQTEPR
jgi:hypothetical protein